MNEKQVKDNRRLRREKVKQLRELVQSEPLTMANVIDIWATAMEIWPLDMKLQIHRRKVGYEVASQSHSPSNDPSKAKGKG